MVFEEVGIFVQVDGFQGELAKSFASVCVRGAVRGYSSASEFGTCSVLFFFISVSNLLYRSVLIVDTHLVIHLGSWLVKMKLKLSTSRDERK